MPPTYRSSSQGNWLLARHAVPMLKKAACVTACVSAVIRSCASTVRWTCLEPKHDSILSTRSQLCCEPRWLMITKGWPLGSTLGPCSEWHDMISTSDGRCFSKAAISGALQDVWPPTMAPCLVAKAVRHLQREQSTRTRSILGNNVIYGFRFYAVYYVVARPWNQMTIWIYEYIFLKSFSYMSI